MFFKFESYGIFFKMLRLSILIFENLCNLSELETFKPEVRASKNVLEVLKLQKSNLQTILIVLHIAHFSTNTYINLYYFAISKMIFSSFTHSVQHPIQQKLYYAELSETRFTTSKTK